LTSDLSTDRPAGLARDRVIGIALGLVLGVAIVAVFVFVFSEQTVDAPSIDHGGGGGAVERPAK
jgi:hypothetical protein